MIYAIETIGHGSRNRYTVKAVTEYGTNPTNGKAYRTEDAARRAAPHRYEPFTELFDVSKLDAIRDKYGVDLYRDCYADALHEVTEAAGKAVHA